MAYETTNPPALLTQRVGASGGAIWLYNDGDPVSTVCGVNYVSNATALGLKAGDRVIHVDSTLLTTTDLTVVTGATTGTASGALCSAIEPVGETSIALQSAGTGTFVIDDIVTFDNDTAGTEYRITTGDTDISDGGTLVITPALVTATAVGTGINIKSDVLNLSSDKSGTHVISGSAATRLLTPSESGAVCLFDRAAGIVYTLPPAAIGLKYRFVTTVSLTSNAYSVLCSTASAGDFMVGAIQGAIEAAATDETHFANGTTHLGLSMNSTTTGGLVGTWIDVEAVSDTLWRVTGVASCTATPATPFTT